MRHICLLSIFILQICFVSAQESNEAIQAKINTFQKDIFIMVDAVVNNSDHIYKNELTYHLLSLKKETNSKTYFREDRQGKFNLLPNEKKTIVTLKLNLEPNQELKLYLFIKNDEQLIAQDSVKLNETLEILKTTAINEDEIEIKGLVVENVKTKIGIDFYDIFYQKYNRSGNKYSFVININEKPFIGGRGSLISIDIGDDKIFEFQARPDLELLENAANYTLKLINNYSKNRNTVEKIY